MYSYNNYAPYQPIYQPQVQPTDDRIFVANQNAAEAYLIAPNSFVRLWDSSKPVFYEKQADATGRLFPLVVYEYKKQEAKAEQIPAVPNYENRLKAIEDKLEALEKRGNTDA